MAPAATGGDPFVAAVKPDGSGLAFSTYLGGGGNDEAGGVALDPSGNAYVSGFAASTDFPTHNPLQAENLGHGNSDRRETFVAKLAPVAAASPLVPGVRRRSGPAGTSVVISGHGFAGASAVHFGTAAASAFTVDSDTQITAPAPSGPSGPVAVTVTSPQGVSPANPIATFTYAQGTWDLTGSIVVPRSKGQTATLLSDGRVLVAGGTAADNTTPLAEAELYDPASARWTAIQSMGTARNQFTATLLSDGRVLVAGGTDQNGQALASAELYDPANGTWAATGMLAQARSNHTATLLGNGKVLVAGGRDASPSDTASAELYDPASGTWSPASSMINARSSHTATLLPGGKVLAVGGGVNPVLTSAEIYDPAADTWVASNYLGRRGVRCVRADRRCGANGDGRGRSSRVSVRRIQLFCRELCMHAGRN